MQDQFHLQYPGGDFAIQSLSLIRNVQNRLAYSGELRTGTRAKFVQHVCMEYVIHVWYVAKKCKRWLFKPKLFPKLGRPR